MITLLKKAINHLLIPMQAFQHRYLSVIIIYFIYGLATFNSIAEMFWIKNTLSLTPKQLIEIAFWSNLAWTFKVFFSYMVDSTKLFKGDKRYYIALSNILLMLGYFVLAMTVYNIEIVSVYSQLIISGVLVSTGLVIQDLVADALCVELVPKTDDSGKIFTKEEMKNAYGSVQLIGRISLMFGFLLASFIGGFIAQNFDYKSIVIFLFIIPILSVMSILYLKQSSKQNFLKNRKLLYLILSFGILFILLSLPQYNFKEEVIFAINLFFTVYMFKLIVSHLNHQEKINLILLGIVIFAYRVQPVPGNGIEWWQIDVLKFNPMFFAALNQISMVLGFVGTWVLSPYFLRKGIFFTVLFLSFIELILKMPIIGMSYGLHEWTMQHFGFGAKTIALIDMTLEGPFSVAFMVPILALGSYYAPKKNNTTIWFALIVSWCNLPFALGRIISKHVNDIFVIERDVYTYVSDVLIYTSAIGFILPVMAVIACQKFYNKSDEIV